ncbi:54S ribosomal protein L36, mitochondrial [Candida viswanathii]|uniref:54S ribosomal protein L36, mitochondrial n=1 Tax=Candida viswanathii TaxID=5486 RepID=A0A367YHB7_9ASCO|nr:54S ribosomal protein L36, mitochondrial [Candida viswanathii]
MFPRTTQHLGKNVQLTLIRTKAAVTSKGSSKKKGIPSEFGASDVSLSGRRVMKKIKLGKARPAIFYQFDTLVELSDGSVVKRFSQAPKDEIRMLNDQRTSLLWNPHRDDLRSAESLIDTGKVGRFRARYGESFEEKDNEPTTKATEQELTPEEEEELRRLEQEKLKKKKDDLFALMGENAEEVVGGKLYDRKADRKRFK